MLEKKSIVNFLLVLSFPFFGLGSYVIGYISPSIGTVVTIIPSVLILTFYCIDSLYKRSFGFRGNGLFFLVNIFLLLCSYSLFLAFQNGIPNFSKPVMISRILATVLIYNAFIPVFLYNGKDVRKVIRLTFQSITILLVMNVIGFYGLGITNAVHSIEGRINFPFIDSFYSGSGILIILTLMMFYYMRESKNQPVYFTKLLLYVGVNLVMIFIINSRLQVLVFLLTTIFFFFNVGMKSRVMYFLSVFFVPILLNFSLLVYKILTLPAMEAILMRVDKEDVTTFHGRAQLWQAALDWLANDQTGIWFGNGYKGHVVLHLLDYEAKIRWFVHTYQMHLHSTAFEWLTTIGVVGYGLFILIMYRVFLFIRNRYIDGRAEGVFMPVVFFIVWVLQIDTLVYLGSVGFMFLMLLWALVTVGIETRKAEIKEPATLKEVPGSENGTRLETVGDVN